MVKSVAGTVFQVQHFSVNDGEGIRSTIFMSGCPLRCKWCCNPESWDMNPGKYAKKMTVSEVLEEVKRQMIFYRYSNGGITFSGGEPTYQAEFLRNLVYNFYDMGIHQTIETSGYFNWDDLEDIFEKLDFIFIDIKHMDGKIHKHYTGCNNETILNNIINIGKLDKETVIRIPLIKNINDSEQNITKTARFISKNIPSAKIEILPYHSLGNYKYDNLGLSKYKNLYTAPDEKDIKGIKDIIKSFDIEVIDFR